MPTLSELVEADRRLAAEITPPWDGDDQLSVARDAAARHGARLDAPEESDKGGWKATAKGVRIDEEQQRHPWSLVGHGETQQAALTDLIGKLNAKAVVRPAGVTCPTCGQPLPNG